MFIKYVNIFVERHLDDDRVEQSPDRVHV